MTPGSMSDAARTASARCRQVSRPGGSSTGAVVLIGLGPGAGDPGLVFAEQPVRPAITVNATNCMNRDMSPKLGPAGVVPEKKRGPGPRGPGPRRAGFDVASGQSA